MNQIKVRDNSNKTKCRCDGLTISIRINKKKTCTQNITKEIAQGFCDSISGIVVVFYLDREVNKKLLQSQQQTDADGLVEKQKTTATSYRNKETPKRKE